MSKWDAWDRCVQWCLVWTLCAGAAVAKAGPVENVGDAMLHPTDPDVITLAYENAGGGLIHTSDGGEHWALGCNSALGASREPFSLAIGGSGEVYLGFFGSMLVDDGGRCAFATAPEFDGQWVSDVTLHPDDPNLVLATTSGGDKENGIWRRMGSGAFEMLGARERVLISRVRVTSLPGGGERYYETIARGETMEIVDGMPMFFPNYFVRSSEDGAETWTEHAFPKTQGTLRLELIDPSDADRLVISVDNTREGDTDFVLVSDDAGANFQQVIEVEQLGGVALATDGRLWVGDEKGGLFAGSLDAETLASVNAEVRPTCVRFDPIRARLYICEDFGFGFYDEAEDAYVELFDITRTEAFLDCEGVRDQVAACEEQMFAGYCGPTHYPGAPICWQNYPDRVPQPGGGSGGSGGTGGASGADGGGVSPDAGTSDSDSDDGCSCSAPGAPRHAHGSAGLLLLAAAGLWLGRPRRR
jgi:MYXO-CTERM domain-containing protein